MHKYATRLLPASSVWKPNHTSPPNAWWVLNHWWPNKAASSHQIRYLHRKTRQNINEETFPVWPCWSQKIFKNRIMVEFFRSWAMGRMGTFHISSSCSPNTSLGFVKLAWFDAFLLQEEECEENYVKKCFIQYGKTAQNVTVNICRTPLVKDCDIDGEEVTVALAVVEHLED